VPITQDGKVVAGLFHLEWRLLTGTFACRGYSAMSAFRGKAENNMLVLSSSQFEPEQRFDLTDLY
jgi:hypothetical protein